MCCVYKTHVVHIIHTILHIDIAWIGHCDDLCELHSTLSNRVLLASSKHKMHLGQSAAIELRIILPSLQIFTQKCKTPVWAISMLARIKEIHEKVLTKFPRLRFFFDRGGKWDAGKLGGVLVQSQHRGKASYIVTRKTKATR